MLTPNAETLAKMRPQLTKRTPAKLKRPVRLTPVSGLDVDVEHSPGSGDIQDVILELETAMLQHVHGEDLDLGLEDMGSGAMDSVDSVRMDGAVATDTAVLADLEQADRDALAVRMAPDDELRYCTIAGGRAEQPGGCEDDGIATFGYPVLYDGTLDYVPSSGDVDGAVCTHNTYHGCRY